MTAHEDAIHPLLGTLQGQWIEAVDADDDGFRVVTSRGAVLQGRSAGGDLVPRHDDGRLLGAAITASALATDGVLTLQLSEPDGRDPAVLVIGTPWTLALPKGAGLAAAADGRIGVREPGAPRFAVPGALRAWGTSAPGAVEIAVLEAATDDWVTPGDVVSALVRAGVTEDGEVRRRGIETLARLVARGDLVAGTVGERGFHPVPDSAADVIEHVATVWTALGARRPGPGQIAWFQLTDAGEAQLLAENRSDTHGH